MSRPSNHCQPASYQVYPTYLCDCVIEPAKLALHLIRDNIKQSAEASSKSTKRVVAESLRGVTNVEVIANLPSLWNLKKQARRHRQKSNNHPRNPTSLEELIMPKSLLPPDSNIYGNGELLLLWDSGYHSTTWRTFLFSSRPNLSILEEAEHWVILLQYLLSSANSICSYEPN